MRPLPWAPLNAGVFLILFGIVTLLSLVGVAGLNLGNGFPLIFMVFGVWLVLVALVFPRPDDRYAPPRSMILTWGGIVAIFGALWFVGTYNIVLVPVVLLVVVIVAGIGAVGYAFTRAESAKKGHSPVA